MISGPRLFVGIGVDQYDDAELGPLDYPVAEVQATSQLLTSLFGGEPLVNVTTQEIRDQLEALPSSKPNALVLLWSGHGRASGSQLWLQSKNGEILATEVVSRCLESGAAQLLLLIDCCHADQAVADAMRVASALLAEYPPQAERVWFGMVVSCRAGETARDGAFGSALLRLLTDGPRSPDMRRRWSRHNRLIYGDDLAAALVEECNGGDQRPRYVADDRRRELMIPNPLWDLDAPEQVVEHLLQAARGEDGDAPSWFCGRVSEVDEVVEWIRQGAEGIRVITGSAGIGKSAIVGRVVSMSNAAERTRLMSEGGWEHADPGSGSVHAHVHAHGLTADLIAELIDSQLVRVSSGGPSETAVLPPADVGWRNAAELVGALQRAHISGSAPPVIAVDGLDEASEDPFQIANDLLVRLAACANVIISTRRRTRNQMPQSLFQLLAPDALLDLDAPAQQESLRAAIRSYVTRRLAGRSDGMNAAAVAEELVARTGTERASFLLARIVVDQLVHEPVDTSTSTWRQDLARSIGAALDNDLAGVCAGESTLADTTDPQQLARGILIALTWASGAGFPEAEWLAVATALTGARVSSDHLSWALARLGRYVVQDGEAEVAVYRMAHQSLVDHLRPPFPRSADQPFDPAAMQVWSALADRYSQLLGDGLPANDPAYLWRYGYRHAEESGPQGLDRLRELAAKDSVLLDSVARADLGVAAVYADVGHHLQALGPTQEAVSIRRGLADAQPQQPRALAEALGNLGLRYVGLGRFEEALEQTQQAANIYRWLTAGNPIYAKDYGAALDNLGNCLAELDRPREAFAAISESVGLFRTLLDVSLSYTWDLAMALNNIGRLHSILGRLEDALETTEEARDLFEILATEDPVHRPHSVMVLSNLANRYVALGRFSEALSAAQEAVILGEELGNGNLAHREQLAKALGNLSNVYGQLDRRHDALAAAHSTVTILRDLAATHQENQADLAQALVNLGSRHAALGQHEQAVHVTQQAIDLLRTVSHESPRRQAELAMAFCSLAIQRSAMNEHPQALLAAYEALELSAAPADNPARKADLAKALDTLGICFIGAGNIRDGATAIERAVTILRDLSATHPEHQADLAQTLVHLAGCYSMSEKADEAVGALEDALKHFRALAQTNPAYQPDLALTLLSLASGYRAVDRADDAAALALQAVAHYRELAAKNEATRSDLAAALTDLGGYLGSQARWLEAIDVAKEIVSLYRQLTTTEPDYEPRLGVALTNLGMSFLGLDQFDDGLAPFDEAVDIYRRLAASNPAHTEALAAALVHLDRLLTAGGQRQQAEERWNETLTSMPSPIQLAQLLIYRSAAAAPGEGRAVAWLTDAVRAADDDAALLAVAYDQGRRHRRADPSAWDVAWSNATAEPAPPWLTVAPNLVSTAYEWIRAGSAETEHRVFEAEYNFLSTHPELLESSADVAVDEALSVAADQVAVRFRRLRATAQTEGIDNAYEPLLSLERPRRFAAAAPAEQREMLQRHFAQLTDESARAFIATAPVGDVARERAQALITLATADDSGDALRAVFEALERIGEFPDTLRGIALGSHADTLLAPAATVARTVAKDPESLGRASIFEAMAAALSGDDDLADQLIDAAASAPPDHRNEWITLLVQIGESKPQVLKLITRLANQNP